MSGFGPRTVERQGLVCGVLLAVLGCAVEPAPEWPQWRGPGGLGVAASAALPVEWSAESGNIRWSFPLQGSGNSSPVAAFDTVYLTEARRAAETVEEEGRKAFERWLLAIDPATGEPKWETPVVTTMAETKHWLSTHAAVTPAADQDGVYVYFGSHLARVLHSGEVAWLLEVDPDYAAHSRYGAASSPVLASDAVIVMQDREWGYTRTKDAGWLAAFERDTGVLRWKVEWAGQEGPCCTYTTPLILQGRSGERLIVAWSWFVREYDLETGDVLWSRDYEINQLASSPVFENDLLIVSGGAHAVKATQAFSFAAGEPGSEPALLWGNKAAVPETSSPLLLGGILYTVTDFGVMSSWRAATGELLWRQRLPQGQYRASLIASDGRIYAASQRGVAVVAAGEEFELLADNKLGGGGRSANASPAIGGGCLLLRTVTHLHCISGLSGGAEAPRPAFPP